MSIIDKLAEKYVSYAPTILRASLSIVFLILAIQQFPEAASIPEYILIFLEVLVVGGLLFGFKPKATGPLAAIAALGIFLLLVKEYGIKDPNIYRDLGIAGSALSLAFLGAGPWSIEDKKAQKNNKPLFRLAFTQQEDSLNSVRWGPLFIRVGIGIVFLLFGIQKLAVPSQTTAEIQLLLDPGGEGNILGLAAAINYYTGLLEVLVGLALMFGLWVRRVATLASFMLFGIFSSFVVRYGFSNDANIFRDIGLLGGAVSLMLMGSGKFSIDARQSGDSGSAPSHLNLLPSEKLEEMKESQEEQKEDEVQVTEEGEYELPPSKLDM